MSTMTATAPAPLAKRKLALLLAPLAILVTAAVVANLGGVSKPAKAAAITVSATVNPATWSDSNGCTNSIALNLNDGTPQDIDYGTCTVTFGITNAVSDLFLGFDASFWNANSNFYTPYAGTNCNGQLPAQGISVKVNTGGTANVFGAGCVAEATGTNVATSEWRNFTRGGSSIQVCQSATIGTKTCPIEFGTRGPAAGQIPAGTYTGQITPTAT